MARTITLNVTVNPAGAVAGAATVTAAISGMSNSSTSFLQKMGAAFNELESFISKALSAFTGFMSQLIGIDALKSHLDKLIDMNTNYNQFIATLTAVKKSASAAKDEFGWLMDTANRMGVNIESTTKNYATLAASMAHIDSTGQSTRAIFEGVSAAASVLHQKGYQTNGVLLAFEQIISKNKLSLEEVQRQLANRLPDAMGMSARAMGMTSVQFRDAIKNDMINPLEFVLKMSNELKRTYGAAAKDTADSFIGQVARMHNAIYQLYVTIGQSGAMDGLTTIVEALTAMFRDTGAGVAFGQALKTIFEEIAGWIRNITSEDVHSFFDGLAVDIRLVVDMLKAMVTGLSDFTGSKPDVLDFTEFVGNSLIVLAETIHTLLAGIMSIPSAFRVAGAGIEIASRDFKSFFGLIPDVGKPGAFDTYNAETQRLRDAKAAGVDKDWDKNYDVFMGKDKPFQGAKDAFAKNMAEARNRANLRKDQLIVPPGLDQFLGIGEPLSDAQVKALSAENDHTPGGGNKKKGRDVYTQEMVALAKAKGTAELEYSNILAGLDKNENKYLITLEAKIKYDERFQALGADKLKNLREMAKAADAANLRERGAEAFDKDRLALNKAIRDTEASITEVMNQQDPVLTKNQRAFEDKLASDAKYKTFSAEMIRIERDKSKELDNLTVRLQNVTKLEKMRYDTLVAMNAATRNMDNANSGLGPNKYNEEQKARDSLMPGGANSTMNESEAAKLLAFAKKADDANKLNDSAALTVQVNDSIRAMQTQIDMTGRTRLEVEAYGQALAVLDTFRAAGIDLSKQENAAALDYANTLINRLRNAYVNVDKANRDWTNGVKNGSAKALDEASNVAGNMANTTANVFKGMEDAFTSLIDGSKFDFTNFAQSIVSQLSRIMVQILIMEPIIKSFRESIGGSGGSDGFMTALKIVGNAMLGGGGGGDMQLGEGVGTYNDTLTETDLNFSYSAKGNAFDSGNIQRFAAGGAFTNSIVGQPTVAPMAMFGEAGAEAIMPLGRTSSGELGIKTDGGANRNAPGIAVTYAPNIQIDSRTDQGEVRDIVNRAVQQGNAELIEQLQRSGAIAA